MSQELNGTLTNSANLVGTFGTGGGGGTTNYNDLTNKPQINGVTLQGNKTTSNLNISYNDLTNKPTIPAAQVNSDWNSTSGVSEILNKPSLAAVATSGSYSDLTNTPTIPAAQVNSDWNSSSGVSEILNKPSLAAVATSGSYNDLTDTPTIPVNSDFALSGLSDTDITTPTANQVLAYDGSKWVNGTVSTVGSIDDLNDVKLTSATAGQGLQFATIDGELTLVNTSRNIIKHTQISGTTDGTGDLLITDLPLASYQILSAYKNRTITGQSAVGYCILGGNNQTHPYIHIIKSDNTNLASTAVTLEVYYVEI